MDVLDFVKSKGVNLEDYDAYFMKFIWPLISNSINADQLREAAILYEANREVSIRFLEIHENFNSIVAMMVHELSLDDTSYQKYVDMSPGPLVIVLAEFHYNIMLLGERGSVEYRNKYIDRVNSIIDYVVENGVLINGIHREIIDFIKDASLS